MSINEMSYSTFNKQYLQTEISKRKVLSRAKDNLNGDTVVGSGTRDGDKSNAAIKVSTIKINNEIDSLINQTDESYFNELLGEI